jgi:radical SAM protein with 4Fe4S-binding SPASM domain
VRNSQETRAHHRPRRRDLRLPGFSGEKQQSVGTILGAADHAHRAAAEKFEALAAWKSCGDCAFIPVCAGGCTTAAHAEFNDIQKPNCHLPVFQSGVKALAMKAAAGASATA